MGRYRTKRLEEAKRSRAHALLLLTNGMKLDDADLGQASDLAAVLWKKLAERDLLLLGAWLFGSGGPVLDVLPKVVQALDDDEREMRL